MVLLNEVIILKSILRGYYYLKITMKELLPSVW